MQHDGVLFARSIWIWMWFLANKSRWRKTTEVGRSSVGVGFATTYVNSLIHETLERSRTICIGRRRNHKRSQHENDEYVHVVWLVYARIIPRVGGVDSLKLYQMNMYEQCLDFAYECTLSIWDIRTKKNLCTILKHYLGFGCGWYKTQCELSVYLGEKRAR